MAKIHTRTVWQMTDAGYELISDEFYEYDGPVAQAKKGGGGGSTQVVEKSDPWSGQQPYLEDLFKRAQAESNRPHQYYPAFDTTVGFNPLQEQAFGGMLDFAGSQGLQDQIGAAQNASLFGMNPMANPWMNMASQSMAPGQAALGGAAYRSLNPESGITGAQGPTDVLNRMMTATPDMSVWNPVMQGVTQNAVEDFKNQILPSIRSEALGAGQMGSSRHQLATAQAADYMSENLLNTQAQLGQAAASEALKQQGIGAGLSMDQAGLDLQGQVAREAALQNLYGQGIQSAGVGLQGLGNLFGTTGDMFKSSLALAPTTMGMGAYPSSIYGGVGSAYQGLAQQQTDEDVARFFANEGGPYNTLSGYSGLIQGNYGGTSTSTQPYYENRLMNALGGAGMGLGFLNAGVGAFGGMPTFAGLGAAGTQGLYGGLGALLALSDRRMKTDIHQLGAMANGLPIYRFRYKGDPMTRIGVMAQDVEQVVPEAVIESGGIKYVDYGYLGERHGY